MYPVTKEMIIEKFVRKEIVTMLYFFMDDPYAEKNGNDNWARVKDTAAYTVSRIILDRLEMDIENYQPSVYKDISYEDIEKVTEELILKFRSFINQLKD